MWAIVARPFTNRSSSVYGFDTLAYTGPNIESVFSSWRLGKIPLWESGFFGGVPYLGRLGSQALYFPHLPLVFLSSTRAIEVSVVAHLLALSIGTILFVRQGLRLMPLAASGAAVVIMGSAFLSVKTLSFDQVVAISLLPWILLFVEKTLSNPSRWTTTGLVICASLLLLGGHPQFIYIEACLMIFYIAGRLIDLRSLRPLRAMIGAGFLTIGVCSLQLYATYTLTSSSAVAGKRPLQSLANSGFVVNPARLNLALVGDAFNASPISVSGSAEAILGIGILASLLTVVGMLAFRGSRRIGLICALVSVTIIGILLSVGPKWWPFRIAYDIVPGIGSARVPGRWLLLSLFGCAFLTALAIQALADGVLSGRIFSVSTLAILGTVGVLLSPKFLTVSRTLQARWIAAGLFLVLVIWMSRYAKVRILVGSLVLVLLFFEGAIAGSKGPALKERSALPIEKLGQNLFWPLRNQPGKIFSLTYDKLDDKEYLKTSLRPNTQLYANLNSIDGYDGGMWIQRRWVYAMGLISQPNFNTDLTLRSQVEFPVKGEDVARFGVRWVITDTTVLPGSAQFVGFSGPVVKAGSLEIWENLFWRGDSYIYVQTRAAPSTKRAVSLLAGPRPVGPNVGVVEKKGLRLRCQIDCGPRTLSTLYQTNDAGSVLFEIDRPGVLVIGQAWSPDWKVYVNGKRSDAFPVDVNMLGVLVSPGLSNVTYKYSPTWFRPLLALSIFSFLVTICLGFIGERRIHLDGGQINSERASRS